MSKQRHTLSYKTKNMKKTITLIIGLLLSSLAYSQKSVAVYVTSSDGISSETKRILGSELVSAITRADDYIAVERTAEFMEQVSQERGNYEIDDAKLYDLGKKIGAFARRHLAEVEAENLFSRLLDSVQQIHQFLVFHAARDRRAGVRAELRVETVDVNGDVNLLGKYADNLVADLTPVGAVVHAPAVVAVVKSDDSAVRLLY